MKRTRKLEKTVWRSCFDSVSKLSEEKRVHLEVEALNFGSQAAAAWSPFLGITYDSKDDILSIMTEGLNHMIRKPRDVFVEMDGVNLLSMNVVDADGVSRVLRFEEPVFLPAH